jgi:hypothetical protein
MSVVDPYDVLSVARDGDIKVMWSSASEWFMLFDASPSSATIVGATREFRTEFMIVDPS